jgi:hypothetical protein
VLPSFSRSRDHPYYKSLSQITTISVIPRADMKIHFPWVRWLLHQTSITDASEKICLDTPDGSGGRCTSNGGVWNAADYTFGSLACWRPRASGVAYASVRCSCLRIRDACVSAGVRPRPVLARALNDQSNQGIVNRARKLVLQQGEYFPSVVFDIMQSI